MKFILSPTAIRQLQSLPLGVQKRIASKLRFFAEQSNPMRFGKKLTGYDLYRFRIGEYRIMGEPSHDSFFVLAIVKRDDAYKDL